MKRIFCLLCVLFSVSSVSQETLSPKPGITVNGIPCLIQNLVLSCVPRTCDSLIIMAGDSIGFCTYQEIELNVDSAYWLRWNFYGASNLADTIYYGYPNQVPICHNPRWDSAGTYTVEVFYNGWLSAYPTSDCYQQGPSHWFVKVVVLPNPSGIEEHIPNQPVVGPNPSSGKFSLLNTTSASQVTITDVYGRTLFQTTSTDFDLSPFGSGMYFAIVTNDYGTISVPIIVE